MVRRIWTIALLCTGAAIGDGLLLQPSEPLQERAASEPFNKQMVYRPGDCKHQYDLGLLKSQPYNDALAERLRKYEEVHSSSSPLLDVVADLGAYKGPRYVIWTSTSPANGGLSSRLLGLVSAFLMAIITDRVLLVDFEALGSDSLFCNPFPYSDWQLPRIFPLEMLIRSSDVAMDADEAGMRPASVMRLRSHEKSASSQFASLSCGESLKQANDDVQFLVLDSDQYFVPLLFTNPSTQEVLQRLFPDRKVFAVLATYLLHPANDLWHQIKEIANNMMPDGSPELPMRIQLDRHNANITHADSGPSAEYHTSEQHGLTSFEMQRPVLAASENEPRHEWSQSMAYSSLPDPHLRLDKDAVTNIVRGEVVDLWALSMLPHLMVAAESTFGMIVHGLQGRPTSIVHEDLIEGDSKRARSREPCYYGGPALGTSICGGTVGNLWPEYLGNCQGEHAGLQLIVS